MPEDKEARQRKPRADRGPRLTDRDFSTLAWIAEQYAICADHLAILLARHSEPKEYEPKQKVRGELTMQRTTEIIKRWEHIGLVERKVFNYGDPTWVWLTAQGLHLVSEQLGLFRSHSPVAALINHYYWTNHARLYIEQQDPNLEWQSEREIKAGYEKLQSGGRRPHTPDAIIINDKGQRIALEVELSTKTYSRLEKILLELATSDYQYIWYFTLGRAKEVARNAIHNMDAEYRYKFSVHPMEDLKLK